MSKIGIIKMVRSAEKEYLKNKTYQEAKKYLANLNDPNEEYGGIFEGTNAILNGHGRYKGRDVAEFDIRIRHYPDKPDGITDEEYNAVLFGTFEHELEYFVDWIQSKYKEFFGKDWYTPGRSSGQLAIVIDVDLSISYEEIEDSVSYIEDYPEDYLDYLDELNIEINGLQKDLETLDRFERVLDEISDAVKKQQKHIAEFVKEDLDERALEYTPRVKDIIYTSRKSQSEGFPEVMLVTEVDEWYERDNTWNVISKKDSEDWEFEVERHERGDKGKQKGWVEVD